MEVLDRQPLVLGLAPHVDERAARRALRDQVARLERRLAEAVVSGFPHTALDAQVGAGTGHGPRVLDLGELEALRDALADRLRDAQAQLEAAGERQAEARLRLEALLADPRRHRRGVVTLAELGERGCGAYRSVPRLGLVGMLMGWWHVKLSSGCPLAPPAAPPAARLPRRMSKRTRKRGGSPTPRKDRAAAAAARREAATARAQAAPRPSGPPSRRARLSEAPRPAWHPVPLTEFAILVGIVLLAVGFFSEDRPAALLAGFALVALASGELAAREHVAGYRSHTTLLSGLLAVALAVVLVVAGVPQVVVLPIALAVGIGAVLQLRAVFKRASGGLGFRA